MNPVVAYKLKKCVLTLKEICVFIVIFVQDCELIKLTTCQFLTLELKSMVSSTFMEALIKCVFNSLGVSIIIEVKYQFVWLWVQWICHIPSWVVMSWYEQVNSLKINEIRYYHIAFIISIIYYFKLIRFIKI